MRVSPPTFQVSQGSAATDLRWGENFNKFLFRSSLLNIAVKNYENPTIFARVIEKIKVSFFMDHSVYSIWYYKCHGFLLCCVQLFDYIASCIAGFVHEHQLETKSLPLGFTFSFPCRQEGLAIGRLETWSKGFKCSGVVGEDVVSLLHDAIRRRRVCICESNICLT